MPLPNFDLLVLETRITDLHVFLTLVERYHMDNLWPKNFHSGNKIIYGEFDGPKPLQSGHGNYINSIGNNENMFGPKHLP